MHFMTMEENLQHNKKDLPNGYEKYDNYDTIEAPKVFLIPSDYDGVIGAPITYLGNHNPEEFELIWTTDRGGDGHLEELKNLIQDMMHRSLAIKECIKEFLSKKEIRIIFIA